MPEAPTISILLATPADGLYVDTKPDATTGKSIMRVRDSGGVNYKFVLGADGTGPGGIGRALSLVAE